ncbi:hypothetical protein FFF34_012555 [Inquilinus sp. KBS0705]|nr:hypothetical protein FFF34_012555 [Inquilinus sp. KBS0705]
MAKKGLWLLAVLLSFFTFSGVAVAQQQHYATQTEAFYKRLPNTKGAVIYKSASLKSHKQNPWFLNTSNAVATANYGHLVSIYYNHQKQIVKLLPNGLLRQRPARTDLEMPASSLT